MSDPPARVLFVCTANRARSPMAEVIARDAFDRAGFDLSASSAGFLEPGWPAEPEALAVARRRGLDLSDRESKQLDADLVGNADLILTMTSDHAMKITSGWPSAASRTFVLAEVGTPVFSDGPKDISASELRLWAAAAASRPRPDLLGGTVDIADPMGRGTRAFRRAADQIGAHVAQLVVLLG